MLTTEEKSQIVQASRAWAIQCGVADQMPVGMKPILLPDTLIEWLKNQGPEWKRQMRSATIREIVLLAAAAIYGPQGSEPPDDIFTRGLNHINVENFEDCRAVEHVLVYGVLLPEGDCGNNPWDARLPEGDGGNNPWDARWLNSWDTLFQMICIAIKPAIYWIGNRVCHLTDRNLNAYAFQESAACASILRGHLVGARCDCWQRWADFHIESIVRALFHCLPQHRLDNWNGTDSLMSFLFLVCVQGDLRLANPQQKEPERAFVNDFRRGMLAKCVSDNQVRLLMSGPILRCCATQGCSGEIALGDKCDSCQQPSTTKQPSWWLWPVGERVRVNCRRCRNCKCLYFQWNDANHNSCSWCEASRRSKRPTVVWVEVSKFDEENEGLVADAVAQPPSEDELIRLKELILVVHRLFVDRRPLLEIYNAEGIDVTDREKLRNWIEQIVTGLDRLMKSEPHAEDEVEQEPEPAEPNREEM